MREGRLWWAGRRSLTSLRSLELLQLLLQLLLNSRQLQQLLRPLVLLCLCLRGSNLLLCEHRHHLLRRQAGLSLLLLCLMLLLSLVQRRRRLGRRRIRCNAVHCHRHRRAERLRRWRWLVLVHACLSGRNRSKARSLLRAKSHAVCG